MNIAYLNGEFLPLDQAKISPLDRGFLFGDGIYEVIPTYNSLAVGLNGHLRRLHDGLAAIGITSPMPRTQWEAMIAELVARNAASQADGNVGVYIQVSRGADSKRHHAYPNGVTPTIFAFTIAIPAPPTADRATAKGYRVALEQDQRWQRCHIKSTSLLGNVMHYQTGSAGGLDETILFNKDRIVTEASSSNVFIVKDDLVITPPLDNQILPGITRDLVIRSLANEGINVEQRHFSVETMLQADEVWLTSSSKEIAPVIEIKGSLIGDGSIGKVWENALTIYNRYKFEH